MPYTIKLQFYGENLLSMEREILNKDFLERLEPNIIFKILFKRQIFNYSNEIEIKFPCYRPFSTFWNIYGGLCLPQKTASPTQMDVKYEVINRTLSIKKKKNKDLVTYFWKLT